MDFPISLHNYDYQIQILDNYFNKNTHWSLVYITLPKMCREKRSKTLDSIIVNEKLSGLMELWFTPIILYKPKEKILAILIYK